VENPNDANASGAGQPGDSGDDARRRDPVKDLQARLEAAIDEVRPKIRKAMEELDSRVDEAMADVRPRAQQAMQEVRPKVDQFVADVQPRLDSLLHRLQNKIEELRKDLDERAAKTSEKAESAASGQLPPAGETRPDEGPGAEGTLP
jgi:ElaB/YqjD/DUF883 family membrane-anchored ribosome-binding protein